MNALTYACAPAPSRIPPTRLQPLLWVRCGLRYRVLIAEDSKEHQLLLRTYLWETVYDLELVDDGQAAIDAFCSERFDIVLMDLQMPGVDGYAATRKIRLAEVERGTPRTPILALSSHSETGDL